MLISLLGMNKKCSFKLAVLLGSCREIPVFCPIYSRKSRFRANFPKLYSSVRKRVLVLKSHS